MDGEEDRRYTRHIGGPRLFLTASGLPAAIRVAPLLYLVESSSVESMPNPMSVRRSIRVMRLLGFAKYRRGLSYPDKSWREISPHLYEKTKKSFFSALFATINLVWITFFITQQVVQLIVAFGGFYFLWWYHVPVVLVIWLCAWLMSYCAKGHSKNYIALEQKYLASRTHLKGAVEMTNHVTITLGEGATFTGPVLVGENIRFAQTAANSAHQGDLRVLLERLVHDVAKLVESTADLNAKSDISVQLKTFAEEAKKEKPSRWALDVSAKGLIEAASSVAQLAAPITQAINAVLAMVVR